MKPIIQPQAPLVRFRSAGTRASCLRSMLWLSVLVAASRVAVLFASSEAIDRPDLISSRVLAYLLEGVNAASIGVVTAAVLTWVLWVAWTSRLEQNAVALGVGEGSVGPRGAILWWLVPGLNLLVPFGQLVGLDRRLSDGQRSAHDALLTTWWLVLLAGGAAVLATAVPLAGNVSEAGDANLYLRAGLATLVWLAALLLSLRVVGQVQGDEDARSDVVRRGWRPGAPSWPVAGPGSVRSGASPAVVPSDPLGPAPRPKSGIPTGPGPLTGTRPAAGRRRSGTSLPGVIVFVALIGGLVGLIYGSRLSPSSSRGPTGVPTPPRSLVTNAPSLSATPSPAVTAVAKPSAILPGSSPTSAASTPAAPASARPSAAANVVLMQHVGAGDGSCGAADPDEVADGSVGAIDCRPGNAAVATLQYTLFPGPDEAEQAYAAALAAAGIRPGTGSCFDAIEGEGGFITDHTTRGRVFCRLDAASVPTVTWFDRTLAIVGRATGTGDSLKDLCDWWANESGPA